MNRRELLRLGAAAGAAGLTRWAPPAARARSQPSPPQAVPEGRELRLNWNENPMGLAPSARRAALAAIDEAHHYPDALREELTAALARRSGVPSDHVVLGAGSTEILQMAVQAAASPGVPLVLAEPTFEAVLRYQRPLPYRVERAPLDAAFAHDLAAMRALAGSGPAVVYLCNPNNPTATLTPTAAIDAWIAEAPETVLFLVDEAYHEYVQAPGYRSAARWVLGRPNVVVTRTFSKIYAMAGLRLGYALAHPDTARRLEAQRAIDNANGPALAAALAVLADEAHLPRSRAANERAKRIVYECLEELDLPVLPSHASFVMHRVGGDLATYIGRMREAGIRVGRPFPPLLGYNRLTLGLPEQMERFTETLRAFRRRGWV